MTSLAETSGAETIAKKTLFMVEDETLLCDLFAEYVELLPTVEFLGAAHNGVDAMKRILEDKPDLLVLDVRMPEMNGLEVLSLLQRKLPECRVIVFTGTIDDETLALALRYKAAAFVEKSSGLDSLRQGIESVMKGEKYYTPGVARLIRNFHF